MIVVRGHLYGALYSAISLRKDMRDMYDLVEIENDIRLKKIMERYLDESVRKLSMMTFLGSWRRAQMKWNREPLV